MNWLFIRGWAREQRHTTDFHKIFESLRPEDRLLGIDLPGTGTEIDKTSPCNIKSITQQTRAHWLKLREGLGEPWGLIGFSLGGMVALDWVSHYSKDFSRLILINTSAGGICPIHKRIRPSIIPRLLDVISTQDNTARERKILSFLIHSSPESDTFRLALQRWAKIAHEAPISRRTAICQLVAAAKFKAPHRLGIPLLVLASAQDQLVHPECSLRLAEKYKAPYREHSLAGHDLALDDPTWLVEQL